jgi:hypothetical protein
MAIVFDELLRDIFRKNIIGRFTNDLIDITIKQFGKFGIYKLKTAFVILDVNHCREIVEHLLQHTIAVAHGVKSILQHIHENRSQEITSARLAGTNM